MKLPSRIRKIYRSNTVFKIVLTIAALLAVTWGVWRLVDAQIITHPLGNELGYIGQEHYGCPFICDSEPSVEYIYKTNMTLNEITTYFKHAKLNKELSDLNPTPSPNTSYFLRFTNSQTSKDFLVSYEFTRANGFTFFVDSKDYETAKASL